MRSSRRNPTSGHAGFTLVELLIVVVLLGILATIALPSALSDRSEAVRSALKANVQNVGMVLEYHRQQTSDGSFPSAIDDAWFTGGSLPGHPDQMAGVPLVETVNLAGVTHPVNKIVDTGSPGAYWYDVATGAFRARVKKLGSDPETLAYYNAVNGSSALSLAATLDSRPSGSSGGSSGSGADAGSSAGDSGSSDSGSSGSGSSGSGSSGSGSSGSGSSGSGSSGSGSSGSGTVTVRPGRGG